jgi:4-amino-4-deoxy-L-arabinose transferase-like glycosyltransferase
VTRIGPALAPVVLAAAVWAGNAVWLARDTRPPVWDMAMHQAYALDYLPGRTPGQAMRPLAARSGNYPPFVHGMIALCYGLVHPSPRVAALANLPATLLLFWAVYLLALDLAGRTAALWAVVLTATTPFLLWMSRETVLDYWLAAWVASALALLGRSDGFARRRESLALGLVLGLGMLTKWLFAGFLVFPLLYACWRARVWREPKRAVHVADALLLGGAVAAVWYVPNLGRLAGYFMENAAIGAEEGEPVVLSFQSAIYYLRLLEGYQLFAPLFVLVAAGVFQAWRHALLRGAGPLAAAVAGGWLVLTLLRTKDPRFSMPLLGLLCVPAGAWVASWGTARWAMLLRAGLVLLLAAQAYMINFGLRGLPQAVVLAPGYQGTLRWDWNLYLQHYFHILGPPRREDWRQLDVLRALERDAAASGLAPTLAVVPDLPRLSAANLHLAARLARLRVRVDHVRTSPDPTAFEGYDYAFVTEREQGIAWTTRNSAALTRAVFGDPAMFRLVETFLLPNGDGARLYAIQRAGR